MNLVAATLFVMAALYSAPNLSETQRDVFSISCFAAGLVLAIFENLIR